MSSTRFLVVQVYDFYETLKGDLAEDYGFLEFLDLKLSKDFKRIEQFKEIRLSVDRARRKICWHSLIKDE